MTEQIEETGDTRGNRIVGEMMQLIAENQNISVTHSVKVMSQRIINDSKEINK